MWRFALARATGTSHLRVGGACQDQVGCLVVPARGWARGSGAGSEFLVSALADGAGSAANGGVGAAVAVRSVLDQLGQDLGSGGDEVVGRVRAAAIGAREAVLAQAETEGDDPRSYATTLLVAVAGPDGGAAVQIGDGVIVAGSEDEGWRWVFWPQRGEFANSTRFLTDPGAVEAFELTAFEEAPQDLALMSDGLEPLALHYATRAVHEPFFRGLFGPLAGDAPRDGGAEAGRLSASLAGFLDSDRVRARTDDDLSLILATRRPPG